VQDDEGQIVVGLTALIRPRALVGKE
jgi:hypothetical protein